jgi:glycosyltransferase involved in cell wall biosynthesis
VSVTVAISTFRASSCGWLLDLLQSLDRQTVDFRTIIVVNSDQRYFEELESVVHDKYLANRRVDVLFNPVDKGIAFARNIAMRESGTPYVAYTDDDVIAHPCWLQELVSTLEFNGEVGAATGPVLGMWEPGAEKYANWFPKEMYWIIGCTPWNFKSVRKVRNGFASNLAVKREVALALGGFNESFGYNQRNAMAGEEPELGMKLIRSGWQTIWNPRAVVHHRISPSRMHARRLVTRAFVEGKTKARLTSVYGNSNLDVEREHLRIVFKRFIGNSSLKAKASLWILTTAVFFGYLAYRLENSDNGRDVGDFRS